jgi:hypothetical protein
MKLLLLYIPQSSFSRHTAILVAHAGEPIPNSQLKRSQARLVLGWGITRESRVPYSRDIPFCFIFYFLFFSFHRIEKKNKKNLIEMVMIHRLGI